MNHRVLNYDYEKYNFREYLLKYYKRKYGSISFDEYHKLLETDKVTLDTKEYYKNIPLFGKTDRKSIFVSDFYDIFDNDYTFLHKYINFIKDNIQPLFNETLVIQKTPNIRFHLDGCSNIGRRDTDTRSEIIGVHYDGEFGHPEGELNIVLPITDMYDTNSIYYESEPGSNVDYDEYCNMTLKKNQFYMGNLNKCKHYNRINKTGKTRVSFDFRVIPYSKFKNCEVESATSKMKFSIGEYYMLLD